MKLNKGTLLGTALVAGFVLAGSSAVQGLVLAAKTAEQKQRKDVGKQGAKHALCMAKASLKCEENGVSDAPECNLTDPNSSTVPDPDNKIIPKLIDSLNKCTSKLNYAKKGNFYTEIGCPGDASPPAPDDPFADLASYQASVGAATRAQLDLLGVTLDAICTDNACGVEQGNLGLRYAKGLFKCVEKCENDYKDKKGNGGGTDSTTNCAASGGDANMAACVSKVAAKVAKKGTINPVIKVAIDAAVADASNDLYNEDDCP